MTLRQYLFFYLQDKNNNSTHELKMRREKKWQERKRKQKSKVAKGHHNIRAAAKT